LKLITLSIKLAKYKILSVYYSFNVANLQLENYKLQFVSIKFALANCKLLM